MVYCVISDIHAHSWSLYSKQNADGVNSRLRIILDEMERAAKELISHNGDRMIIAGDLFHQRGQIDPEVLNPVRDTVERIMAMGIDIEAIPGNHDLKSADTSQLSSSIQNLSQISLGGQQFQIHNSAEIIYAKDNNFAFVPWRNTKKELMEDLADLAKLASAGLSATDVFIHAGIDGVLDGSVSGGLTHQELAAFGFRNVFAGHYHNHKDFGDGVVSIGATAHHNWGDIGTKAGFLLVDERTGTFEFRPTEAPRFIDVSGLTEDEMLLTVPGNYARFRGPAMSTDEVNELRDYLRGIGAVGVSIEAPRTATTLRSSAPGKAMSVSESIEAYVTAVPPVNGLTVEEVAKRSIEVFNESRSVSD